VHSPSFAKDQTYLLFDALDPAATRVFIDGVHKRYLQALGDHLSTTVLGIMGDGQSFPGIPWIAALPDEFLKRKGYDMRRYLSRLIASTYRGCSVPERTRFGWWSRIFESI
jgi:hypothetical protein